MSNLPEDGRTVFPDRSSTRNAQRLVAPGNARSPKIPAAVDMDSLRTSRQLAAGRNKNPCRSHAHRG